VLRTPGQSGAMLLSALVQTQMRFGGIAIMARMTAPTTVLDLFQGTAAQPRGIVLYVRWHLSFKLELA